MSLAIDSTSGHGLVGVGLRHAHYQQALAGTSSVDFVELHAENFFAENDAVKEFLADLVDRYPLSLHATSLGLGSAEVIDDRYLRRFSRLVDEINPLMVSDHASFSWSEYGGKPVHAADLLPLEFNSASLAVISANVTRVQERLGRQLLVENISNYLPSTRAEMSETDFLLALVERTGCGLLVDLNNLLVNAHNFGDLPALAAAQRWVDALPRGVVGEIHLAGNSGQTGEGLIVDDHARAVDGQCWQLFRYTIERLGPVPTLIEWDNDLPAWETLLTQAEIAHNLLYDFR